MTTRHFIIDTDTASDDAVAIVMALQWPDVEVDIRTSLSAEALPALMREDVDLAITSTPVTQPGTSFHPLFDYLPRLVCAAANPLAEHGGAVLTVFPNNTSQKCR